MRAITQDRSLCCSSFPWWQESAPRQQALKAFMKGEAFSSAK